MPVQDQSGMKPHTVRTKSFVDGNKKENLVLRRHTGWVAESEGSSSPKTLETSFRVNRCGFGD